MHIFRHIFLSNYWWQKSDIWSQASYRYPISWEAFLNPSDSCLPTLLIFIHIEHICSFFVAFFSATIDGRNLIFGHKLHIGTQYRGKRFLTRQIPTSCLPKSGDIISSPLHVRTCHMTLISIDICHGLFVCPIIWPSLFKCTFHNWQSGCRHGRIVVGFTTTCAISAYHHYVLIMF